jgi:Outer membrane protein beta-barrel domain
MKKNGLLLFFLAAVLSGHAQIGFEGGLNMANLNIKSYGTTFPSTYKAGASMGFMGDIRVGIKEHIYIEPGVYYQNDGAKMTSKPTWNYDVNSLTFPIFLEYKSGDRCNERFFAGIGPYFRYNINGYAAYNFSGISGGGADLRMGTDFSNTDYGIGVNLGYIGRKHWFIKGNYLYGLANNLPNGDNKNYIKQATGGLTLGYMFRGCNGRRLFGGGGGRGRDHWRGVKKGRWSTKSIYHRPKGPGSY